MTALPPVTPPTRSSTGATYLQNHLRPITRGREVALRDLMGDIVTSVGKALASLRESSEFAFRFWSHSAGLIVQDLDGKSDRLERDDTTCQAAHLVRYYAVWRRGKVQREAQREAARRDVEEAKARTREDLIRDAKDDFQLALANWDTLNEAQQKLVLRRCVQVLMAILNEELTP